MAVQERSGPALHLLDFVFELFNPRWICGKGFRSTECVMKLCLCSLEVTCKQRNMFLHGTPAGDLFRERGLCIRETLRRHRKLYSLLRLFRFELLYAF